MKAPLVVVKLDNARYGAGPGTVLEVTDEGILTVRQRYADRDGAIPDDLRFWTGSEGVAVGDRVATNEDALPPSEARCLPAPGHGPDTVVSLILRVAHRIHVLSRGPIGPSDEDIERVALDELRRWRDETGSCVQPRAAT